MAPSATQVQEQLIEPFEKTTLKAVGVETEKPKNIKRQIDTEGGKTDAKYPQYLPVWDYDSKWPPLEPFEHYEHGKDADPTFPDILGVPGVKHKKLTPVIGSEITGVQLSSLSDAGKDQLALLVAQRGVIAFRDQDFADLPLDKALDFGRYFGRLHMHQTSPCPEGYPEFHLIHRYGADGNELEKVFMAGNTSTSWHSDITFEEQPAGTTIFYALEVPEAGGDTCYVSTVEAYKRLSDPIKRLLHGLKATHTGNDQVATSKKVGGIQRREPVTHVHPLVRTHPATGEKSLFVNGGFTRDIIGLKNEESEMLLNFLRNHIRNGQDFQCRVKWEPGTVTVWDNRVTGHTATIDWFDGSRRHLARITPQAEKPYETPLDI